MECEFRKKYHCEVLSLETTRLPHICELVCKYYNYPELQEEKKLKDAAEAVKHLKEVTITPKQRNALQQEVVENINNVNIPEIEGISNEVKTYKIIKHPEVKVTCEELFIGKKFKDAYQNEYVSISNNERLEAEKYGFEFEEYKVIP